MNRKSGLRPMAGYNQGPAPMTDNATVNFESLHAWERINTAAQQQSMPLPIQNPPGFRSLHDQPRSHHTHSSVSGSPGGGSISGSATNLDYWTPPLQQPVSPATSFPSSASNGGFKEPLSYGSPGHLKPPDQFDIRSLPSTISSFELGSRTRGNRSHDNLGQYWDELQLPSSHPVSNLFYQQEVIPQPSHARARPADVSSGIKHDRQDGSVDQASKRPRTKGPTDDILNHSNAFKPTSHPSSSPPGNFHTAQQGRLPLSVRLSLDLWLDRQMESVKGKEKIPPDGSMLDSLCEVHGEDACDIVSYIGRRYRELNQPVPDHPGDDLSVTNQQNRSHPSPSTEANPECSDVNVVAQDFTDADAAARKCEEGPCTTNAQGRKHTGGYECPLCGAHAKTLQEWKRHCRQRWPRGFCRCTGCRNVQSKTHIKDHVNKVCRKTHPHAAVSHIAYDPHWQGFCDLCQKLFEGKRSVATESLAVHIWKEHMIVCEGHKPSKVAPSVEDGEESNNDDDSDGGNNESGDDNNDDHENDDDFTRDPDWYDFLADTNHTNGYQDGAGQYGSHMRGYAGVMQGQQLRRLHSIAALVEQVCRGRTLIRHTSDVRSVKPLSIGRSSDPEDLGFGLDLFGIGAAVDAERAEATQDLAVTESHLRRSASKTPDERLRKVEADVHQACARSSSHDTCCKLNKFGTEVSRSFSQGSLEAQPVFRDQRISFSPPADCSGHTEPTDTKIVDRASDETGKGVLDRCAMQSEDPQLPASRSSTMDSDMTSSTNSDDTNGTSVSSNDSTCGDDQCGDWTARNVLQYSPLLDARTPRPTCTSCNEAPSPLSLDHDFDLSPVYDSMNKVATRAPELSASGSSPARSGSTLELPFRHLGAS